MKCKSRQGRELNNFVDHHCRTSYHVNIENDTGKGREKRENLLFEGSLCTCWQQANRWTEKDGREHAPNIFLIPFCHKFESLILIAKNPAMVKWLREVPLKEMVIVFKLYNILKTTLWRISTCGLCLPLQPPKHLAEATGNNWNISSFPHCLPSWRGTWL